MFRILEIGGKQYKIQFTVNALCDLEKREKCSMSQSLDNGEITGIRNLLWAGTQKHHKDDVDIENAGELIDTFLSEGKSLSGISKVIVESLRDGGFIKKQDKQTKTE